MSPPTLLDAARRVLAHAGTDGHLGSIRESGPLARAIRDLRAAVAEVEAREAVTDPGKGPGHPAKEPT